MNLWPFKRAETRDAGNDPSWNALINQGAISASGQFVDVKTAEGISAVFGCVQALSESTACLPLHVYARSEGGDRERNDDHPLARVLREPNDYQSGLSFRESMTAAVLLHGNAYARIVTNNSGELTALHPLNPRNVSLVKLPSGRYRYDCANDDGRVTPLLQDEVFHLADRTEPGSILGRSRITIARDSLGLALAQRAHGASTFRNGTRLSGVLESDRNLTTEQTKALRDGWKNYVGLDSPNKTFIAPHGIKYKELSMTLADAEWIESMNFSVSEVCRIFRVPPVLVQELSHATFTNVIELGSQFVRFSLQRWMSMWEAEISRSLLGPIARRRYFAEHSVEGLLRGNPEMRADFYTKAIAAGWMDAEEVRKLENLPPRSAAITVE